MFPWKTARNSLFRQVPLILACLLSLSACEIIDPEAEQLKSNTRLELVDWHISGLWVINSPVAWVRVTNMNNVPLHDITFEYRTFAADGHPLDRGTFTIEGKVPAGTTKNFVELYLGLVDLYTERLSLQLLSVKRSEH
ncbi:MAG: hypothetical protein K2X27_04250 [Candidatus Obscuribacterales bacterium]|nr:hypothetical protein [Candidatus Obscuribacterales bacterium]